MMDCRLMMLVPVVFLSGDWFGICIANGRLWSLVIELVAVVKR